MKTPVISFLLLCIPVVATETHDEYTLTPKESQVTVGSRFSLSCKTNSSNGLELLHWSVRKDNEGHRISILQSGGLHTAGFFYNISNSSNSDSGHHFSVLTAGTEDDGQFERIIDYTFYCSDNVWDTKAEAEVKVHPVDYGMRDGLMGAGITVLVLCISLTVFYFWRRRKLRAALAVVSISYL